MWWHAAVLLWQIVGVVVVDDGSAVGLRGGALCGARSGWLGGALCAAVAPAARCLRWRGLPATGGTGRAYSVAARRRVFRGERPGAGSAPSTYEASRWFHPQERQTSTE